MQITLPTSEKRTEMGTEHECYRTAELLLNLQGNEYRATEKSGA